MEQTMEQEPISKQDQITADDLSWMARTGLNEETLSAAIEAIIYVTDKPMSLAKIRDAIDETIPLKTIHQAIEVLQKEYEGKRHGFRLQEVALGYQFRTKATYSKLVQQYLKLNVAQLTPATLEVLAVICYKQPISKTQIDLLRGVDSSHLVRTLIDKKLVTVSGRAEDEPGKPSLYITTSEFLEFFNLASLNDLPKYAELEELAQLEVVSKIPKIDEVLKKDDENVFDFDDLIEVDEIAGKIKDIAVDTDFTKLLRQPPTEQTPHKSPFEVLDQYLNGPAPEETATNLEESLLKEVGPDELERLLDAAFDKLTEVDQKSIEARKDFLADTDDKGDNHGEGH